MALKPVTQNELSELLLPILSCLPLAFVSPRPPPALLPLLSPILRQRVHVFASNSSDQNDRNPGDSTWLRLLTWDPENAERLHDVVSGLQLEAHPVSGEPELFGSGAAPDGGKVWYRQLDEETFQARCDITEHQLGFIWTWCTNDAGGVNGAGPLNGGDGSHGWKISEVVALEGNEDLDATEWSDTLELAIQRGPQKVVPASANAGLQSSATNGTSHNEDGDEDDDYWAAYDQSDVNTPARKASVAPFAGSGSHGTEQDYFARYGQEVQPAMDNHDPDEEVAQDGRVWSTLGADARASSAAPGLREQEQREDDASSRVISTSTMQTSEPVEGSRVHEYPQRAQEPISASVASLEASASGYTAEAAVKHHISGEMKSLFRLAQSVGLDRSEFERLVRTELEVLGLIEL